MEKNHTDILYIEDNPGDVVLIEEYLKLSNLKNFRLTAAETLAEAKETLAKKTFEAILLDLNLPDSQHLQTLDTIIPLVDRTAIIVLTGLDNAETGYEAVVSGAQDFLVKNNITPESLERSLRHSISRKQDQTKLNQLNRILKVIRTINKIIISENDEISFVNRSCKALVNADSHYSAWIVLMESNMNIKHSVALGNSEEIESFIKQLDKNKLPECIERFIDTKREPWECPCDVNQCIFPRETEAISGVTFRLSYKDNFFGFMGIYKTNNMKLYKEEIDLFNELEADLSFGLYNILLQNKEIELTKKLDKKELDYQFITSNSIDCIWQIDTQLKYVFISPSIEQIMDVDPDEWLGHPFIDYLDEKDKRDFMAISKELGKSKNKPDTFSFETYLNYKNKSVPVEIVIKPIYDKDDKIKGFQGATRNVTERILHNSVIREMNQQLKKKNEEYLQVNKRLTESLKEIKEINSELASKDHKLSYLLKAAQTVLEFESFKPTAQKLFNFCKEYTQATSGYVALLSEKKTENEVLFLDAGENECAVDPSLPMPIRGLRQQAYEKGIPVFDNNFSESNWQKFLPKGHALLSNVLFAPLIIKNETVGLIGLANKPGGFNEKDVNFLIPISEICSIALHNARVTENLVLAKLRAEESDKLKSAFLANMSHEIRTPLNAVVGFSALINKEKLSTQDRQIYMDYINSNGQSLVHIIDDIIDISKIESDQLKIKNASLNIRDFLDEIYSYFSKVKQRETHENIDFVFEIDKSISDDFNILSDKVRLKQVITNLLDNAFKYTQKGCIKLKCRKEKEKLLFKIQDTGKGIPKDKLDKIFERFAQFNDTFVSRNYGTGLGLSISKGIIDLMGGEISVSSELGKGSEFTLEVPISIQTKKDSQKKMEISIKKDWSGKRVLIVDDDESSFFLAKRILMKTKANFEWAKDGAEAKKRVEENSYALVLMDIKMPNMDGITATKLIKETHPNLPIVIQTAFAMEKEKQKAFEAGCDEYIIKPIVFDSFVAKMEKLIV